MKLKALEICFNLPDCVFLEGHNIDSCAKKLKRIDRKVDLLFFPKHEAQTITIEVDIRGAVDELDLTEIMYGINALYSNALVQFIKPQYVRFMNLDVPRNLY